MSGSPNTIINNMPALRVGDQGIHASCCGGNTWVAEEGSSTVFINGKVAHRKGDGSKHCGGQGKLNEGSPDVFIGETPARSRESKNAFEGGFKLVDRQTRKPVSGVSYRLRKEDGQITEGITDEDGHTELVTSAQAESLTLEIP